MSDSPPKTLISIGQRGLEIRTIEDAWRFAQYAAKSRLCPKGIETAEQAFIVIQYGMELGLNPMRALTSIHILEGTPVLKAETITAIIRNAGICTFGPEIGNEGTGMERFGFVKFQRRDQNRVHEVRFSMAEAKVAGLLGKKNWATYPDDMLIARAVARTGRRYFSDLLLGFGVAEEVRDYIDVTPTAANESPVTDPLLEAGLKVREAEAHLEAVTEQTANRTMKEIALGKATPESVPSQAPPAGSGEPTSAAQMAPPEAEPVTSASGGKLEFSVCDECGRDLEVGHRINCSQKGRHDE